jgi:hypothetical protein
MRGRGGRTPQSFLAISHSGTLHSSYSENCTLNRCKLCLKKSGQGAVWPCSEGGRRLAGLGPHCRTPTPSSIPHWVLPGWTRTGGCTRETKALSPSSATQTRSDLWVPPAPAAPNRYGGLACFRGLCHQGQWPHCLCPQAPSPRSPGPAGRLPRGDKLCPFLGHVFPQRQHWAGQKCPVPRDGCPLSALALLDSQGRWVTQTQGGVGGKGLAGDRDFR